MTLIRLREIERLISARYRPVLPPKEPVALNAAMASAHHIALLGGDVERHILDWLRLWAPWMAPEAASRIAARAIAQPVKFSADMLAWRLRLTLAERASLGITTIGAVDFNKEQRQLARKVKRASADRERRRKAGAKSRDIYEEASLSRRRPWEELGISRASWYRQGKPEFGLWEGRRYREPTEGRGRVAIKEPSHSGGD